MKTLFTTLFLLILLSTSPNLAIGMNLTAHSLFTETLHQSGNHITVGIRVNASNDDNITGKIYVTVKAVDGRGYEIASTMLTGTVDASDFKQLTTTISMPKHRYEQIGRWEISDVSAYPAR
jgi:hypothetical protein